MAFEMTNGPTGPSDDDVFKAFREAEAAPTGALPTGTYHAIAVDGRFAKSKVKGTPSFKLKFEIADGPFKGRLQWHDLYLTPAALKVSKGTLAAFGVTDVSKPLTDRFACAIRVRVRVDDDKIERNEVAHIQVVKKLDGFAFEEPAAGGSEGGAAS